MDLHRLGLTPFFQDAFEKLNQPSLQPARIIREDKGAFTVATAEGMTRAILRGRLRRLPPQEQPATGDWVAVLPLSGEDKVVIEAVLPRRTVFMRKRAGEVTEAQVVAANVDTVLLVMGLDEDFNVRRLERYLALARDSGATPVVVLNKLDVAPALDSQLSAVGDVVGNTPVVALSAAFGIGLDGLAPYLTAGNTLALLGSSGVGKSTIINALLGEARLDTKAVRASDGRGQHTTTFRDMVLLPGGGAVMDTPGMRELQLWGDEATVDGSFPDVMALVAACRFVDCRHGSEPGCAVRQALESGALDADRLASWRRLHDEVVQLGLRLEERHARQRVEDKRIGKLRKELVLKPSKRRWE
ncbi:MAG: ribosome small subunit-dependent GTPase A [Deltaproteobacteria bacterium]|nr:ribosome small subunit-dependent GTPase A [Deltaproteobacteria bacterium]